MLGKHFEPQAAEAAIYAAWESSGAFAAGRRPGADPYTIVVPPPNVTGTLHVGHALNFTLQDVLFETGSARLRPHLKHVPEQPASLGWRDGGWRVRGSARGAAHYWCGCSIRRRTTESILVIIQPCCASRLVPHHLTWSAISGA